MGSKLPIAKSSKPLNRRTANSSKGATRSAVIERAVEVIGDEPEAMRWLGTPIRALDYATAISLLHTAKGRDLVISVLGRLDHGVL